MKYEQLLEQIETYPEAKKWNYEATLVSLRQGDITEQEKKEFFTIINDERVLEAILQKEKRRGWLKRNAKKTLITAIIASTIGQGVALAETNKEQDNTNPKQTQTQNTITELAQEFNISYETKILNNPNQATRTIYLIPEKRHTQENTLVNAIISIQLGYPTAREELFTKDKALDLTTQQDSQTKQHFQLGTFTREEIYGLYKENNIDLYGTQITSQELRDSTVSIAKSQEAYTIGYEAITLLRGYKEYMDEETIKELNKIINEAKDTISVQSKRFLSKEEQKKVPELLQFSRRNTILETYFEEFIREKREEALLQSIQKYPKTTTVIYGESHLAKIKEMAEKNNIKLIEVKIRFEEKNTKTFQGMSFESRSEKASGGEMEKSRNDLIPKTQYIAAVKQSMEHYHSHR